MTSGEVGYSDFNLIREWKNEKQEPRCDWKHIRSTPAPFSAYITPEVNSCEETQDKQWSKLQLKYKIANHKVSEDILS